MPDIYILADLGLETRISRVSQYGNFFQPFSNRPPSKCRISLSPKKYQSHTVSCFSENLYYLRLHLKAMDSYKTREEEPLKSDKLSLSTTPKSLSRAFLQLFYEPENVVPKPNAHRRMTVEFFVTRWSSRWTSANFTTFDNAKHRTARQPAAPTSPPSQSVCV